MNYPGLANLLVTTFDSKFRFFAIAKVAQTLNAMVLCRVDSDDLRTIFKQVCHYIELLPLEISSISIFTQISLDLVSISTTTT